ncbi:hypothetical protein BC832DRAFT_591454 [Gaertneriomyces semiglobifer]|nr:hypothetical protein BC832DRAFT_591454 [Gaertneriomyces semiglobifer]
MQQQVPDTHVFSRQEDAFWQDFVDSTRSTRYLRDSFIEYPGQLVSTIINGLTLIIFVASIIAAYVARKNTTPIQFYAEGRRRRPSRDKGKRRSRIGIDPRRISRYSAYTTTSDKRRSVFSLGNDKRKSIFSTTGMSVFSGGSAPSFDALPPMPASRGYQDNMDIPMNQLAQRDPALGPRVSFHPHLYGEPSQPAPSLGSPVLSPSGPSQTRRGSHYSVATSPPALDESSEHPSHFPRVNPFRRSWVSVADPSDAVLYFRPRQSPGTFLVASAEWDSDEEDWWEDEEMWAGVETIVDDGTVFPPTADSYPRLPSPCASFPDTAADEITVIAHHPQNAEGRHASSTARPSASSEETEGSVDYWDQEDWWDHYYS